MSWLAYCQLTYYKINISFFNRKISFIGSFQVVEYSLFHRKDRCITFKVSAFVDFSGIPT